MSLLIDAVEKIAPTLATGMLGPLGGVLTSLVEHVCGMSGDALASAVSTDPDLAAKIKKIELEHSQLLAQYNLDDYKTEVDDKKNARSENDKHFWIVATLSIIFVSSYFGFILFKGHLGLTPEDAHQTQDGLTNALFMILSYFYGSSHKSNN